MEDMTRQFDQQTVKLSTATGCGLPPSSLEAALKSLAPAPPHKDFITFKDENFIYEKLDESVDAMVKSLVEQWVDNPENVVRAAAAVGRQPSVPNEELVQAFCGFRFKELREKMKPMKGLAAKAREHSTVVIIAMESLNEGNGCPVNLEKGQDVCLDGNATIILPGTGGGLGVFIDLNL